MPEPRTDSPKISISKFKGRGPVEEDLLADEDSRNDIRQRSKLLDNFYDTTENVSDKVLLMETMSFIRKEKERRRTDIDITYPIIPPYAFVNIVFDKFAGEHMYHMQEPRLQPDEVEKLAMIKNRLEATMDQDELPVSDGGNNAFCASPQLVSYIRKRYDDIIDLFDIQLDERRKPVLRYFLERDLIGLGRADCVLKDPLIEDISCNGPFIPVYVFHRVFGSMKTNIIYDNELELNKFIIKLAQISGKHVSIYQPILDATLCDGSRINITLGSEVTRKGSTFTVRKFSYDPISPIDLVRFGSITPKLLAYFWLLIEYKKSFLVSGGTASGKTTLLNALCMFIKPEDKIVSIEDTPEIQIDHNNWIQSVSRSGYGIASGVSGVSGVSGPSAKPGGITLFDLLVAALRQRPEYIIVGEVRGQEAFTLFQAISVGHAGMGTIHASNMEELMNRVENAPMNIPRVLFQALDVVVFQGLVTYGDRRVRRVKGITEILEIEPATKNLLTNNTYTWNPKNDSFVYSGRSFAIENLARESGRSVDVIEKEIARRETYLKLIDSKNVTYYKDVSRAINKYYVDADAAFAELEKRI